VTKFGKQRSGVVSGYEGRECLIGSGPPDAHCVYVFGGLSSGTPVGADGLHMINLWRKACRHYRSLSDLHFQRLPQFSRSFWLLVVSGFLCSIGMFKSVRKGALFCQTHVSGAI
jgi:hypothetical protein